MAFAGLTGGLLPQSADDIIRAFPSWALERDAAPVDLRARGGLLVSAEQKSGRRGRVAMKATVGESSRVLNPWLDQPVVAVHAATGEQGAGISYSNPVLTFWVSAGDSAMFNRRSSRLIGGSKGPRPLNSAKKLA
mgnify:CR=1 FL=1